MKTLIHHCPASNRRRARGFSLIVTVTLLVLLSLVAVALLGLSSTTLRSSRQSEARRIAESNARFALQLAIGELQRTMGPDTRVSANAGILGKRQQVAQGMEDVAGVWEAWRPDPMNVGDYEARKQGEPVHVEDGGDGSPRPGGGFHRWLVSAAESDAVGRVDFAAKGPAGTSVLLAPDHSYSGDGDIRAGLVKVKNAGATSGGFSWVVFDEGQKANISTPAGPNAARELARLGVQEELAWSRVADWSAVAEMSRESRAKLASFGSVSLAGVKDSDKSDRDLTSDVQGVLADVTTGRLRTDLSLLFAEDELPGDYQERHLYSNSRTPLLPRPNRGGHRYQLPSPDPKWGLLHNFHRIPEDVFGGETGNPRIAFRMNTSSSRSSIPHRPNGFTGDDSYHEAMKLAPVISKAQFIFSLTFASGAMLRDSGTGAWSRDGGQSNSNWKAQAIMIIDPVITLWNPYDVPLDVTSFRVFLYRIPIAFKFDSTNTGRFQNSPDFTDYVMAIAPGANVNRNFAYPLSIEPEEGSRTIELLPGEHRVFSVQDYQTSYDIGVGQNAGKTVTMRPGWFPPGTRSPDNEKIGGISTENLCRDLRGNPSARYKSKNGQWFDSAGVIVEANDQVRISVRPSSNEIGNFQTLGGLPVDFYLRYAVPVPETQLQAGTEQVNVPDFGAIELDYGDRITSILRPYQAGRELPVFPISPRDIISAPVDGGQAGRLRGQVRGTYLKKPFLVASLHLKSLVSDDYRTKFPSKAWIHNNPTSIYASAGAGDQFEDLSAHQYEFSYEPVQGDWNNGGFPEITGDRDQGFGGPSQGRSGRVFAPFASLPRTSPTSLGQYRHAPVNQSGKLPLQAQIIANSFAHPLLPADRVVDQRMGYLDHSFLANAALFDSSFFSTAKDANELEGFLAGKNPLLNPSFVPANPSATGQHSPILGDQAYERAASVLMQDGAFNVNSTSVNAWKTLLTGINLERVPYLPRMDQPGLAELTNSSREAYTSRYQMPLDESLGGDLDPFGGDDHPAWTGHRRLTDDEIDALARALVEEIKLRGPFQSMAEFINRRAEDSDLGAKGALQAAIDKAGLNRETLTDDGITLTGLEDGSSSYRNTKAAEGSSLEGTPGWLTQGDLLQTLAPTLTARSDTFRIRASGSATDRSGRTLATAYCEAVVQRVPDYLDPRANEPHHHAGAESEVPLSKTNSRFGRRFVLKSFRWLGADELASA